MKLYREVLVAYDVEDNKRRDRLFKGLKDIGLRPIQLSVFWGMVLGAEEKAIRRLFRSELNRDEDRAFVIPVNVTHNPRTDLFGYTVSPFEEPGRYDVT
jgi:CRISPR-associated endonuclease Cas2